MNKFKPHVYVIPEDRADAQLANGFVNHPKVNAQTLQVLPPAGGWTSVLETFEREYIPYLGRHRNGHVIMLIDFDGHYEDRRPHFAEAIPQDLHERVFVIGPVQNPEALKSAWKQSFEDIGNALAEDCCNGTVTFWSDGQMAHNEPDRQRLFSVIKPIVFDC